MSVEKRIIRFGGTRFWLEGSSGVREEKFIVVYYSEGVGVGVILYGIL